MRKREREPKEGGRKRNPTGEHRYLRTKGVGAHGLRTNGFLVYVPVRDSEGTLHGLQYISPEGVKKFLTGTAFREHYHIIAEPKDRILIAEGYATTATLREATDEAVAVAFDASNLRPVAEAFKDKYQITVCADDDRTTEGNPGLTKAIEAARAVGARLAIPRFQDISHNPTDFNDLAEMEGAEAVWRCVCRERGQVARWCRGLARACTAAKRTTRSRAVRAGAAACGVLFMDRRYLGSHSVRAGFSSNRCDGGACGRCGTQGRHQTEVA